MFFQIIIQLFLAIFLKTSLAAPSYTHEITEEIPTNEITEELPTEGLSASRRYFNTLNPKNIGRSSLRILKSYLNRINSNISSDEVEVYFKEVDPNGGNGSCSVNNIYQIPSDKIEESVTDAFQIIDNDKDGLISANDLGRLFKLLNWELKKGVLENAIRHYSSSGSTLMNQNEFFIMMTQNENFSANLQRSLSKRN
ncbi:calmodulin-like [Daktulosphaira vitifoliae]|uniref:calmodulin-like n=1 Tax=Daktulosphaira vitifoliae TaxID=58002 RepID=UPI0021AA29C9|nr:calmodulin-like [Daktulosphaira vitifoliae]